MFEGCRVEREGADGGKAKLEEEAFAGCRSRGAKSGKAESELEVIERRWKGEVE